MNKLLKNIFKVSFTNVLSLFSGVLVGFIVPKMMGLEEYANYKIYTLYLTYLALVSLGLGDGLYLKFSGTNKENLEKQKIKFYLHCYYLQLLLIFIPTFLVSLFVIQGEYKFIFIALALTMFSSQITAVHQNLSIITSRFNEYSVRIITKSILTSIFVLILFYIFNTSNNEISYKIFVIGVVLIDYVLAFWYVISYKEFNFGKGKINCKSDIKYRQLLYLGFPLLLSNMAGSIFLNLDRQFVSVLFLKQDYAIYAFAYNMLTLITTMTSAISLVLFPSLRKIQNIDIKESLEKYCKYFSSLVAFCLVLYFPLFYVLKWFLPKYLLSLSIFRIVLPGIMLSSSVSVIFINFYKLDNNIKLYFIKTIITMIIAVLLNLCAYYLFRSYEAISWVSILSLMFWYIIINHYFVKKYKIKWITNIIYLFIIMISFYIITYEIESKTIGMITYLFVYFCVTILLHKKLLKFNRLITRIKEKIL